MPRKVTARKLLILSALIANPQSSAPKVGKIIGAPPANVARVFWELTSKGLIIEVKDCDYHTGLYEATEEGKRAVVAWYDQLTKEELAENTAS